MSVEKNPFVVELEDNPFESNENVYHQFISNANSRVVVPSSQRNPFQEYDDPFSNELDTRPHDRAMGDQPIRLHSPNTPDQNHITALLNGDSNHNWSLSNGNDGFRRGPNRAGSKRNGFKYIMLGGRLKGWPYFTWTMTIIQVAVFIYELVKMGIYTGTVFQTKPYFNPMLGPSSYVQISSGSRYLPCMTVIPNITNLTDLTWPCPNSTATSTDVCSLSELCGLSGIATDSNGDLNPNQWYRLITPMFIHAGFIHIFFNLVMQLMMAAKVEKFIGLLRFALIYTSAGIAGFLLGANFSPAGISSSGASGALFGIIAVNISLLTFNRHAAHYGMKSAKSDQRAFKVLLFGSIAEIIIMIVLGLLPGLDNFSHIGGFVIGLLLSIALLNDPVFVYTEEYKTYKMEGNPGDVKNIGGLMENRKKPQFIIWCICRVVAFVLYILYFTLLARNFAAKGYEASESCKWCKYINCIPVNGWCDTGDLSVSTATTTSSTNSISVSSFRILQFIATRYFF